MEQDNATQTGADSLQPAHSGRNAALAQIAKAVDASYQEDMNSFDEETGQVHTKQAQEQQPAPVEEGAQEQQESQQATQQASPEDVETIVVDGQQVQVKRTQLLDAGRRTLQKESAAEKRLQEATEMLRQAQAYSQSLRQNAQPSQDAGQLSQSLSQDATNGNGLQSRQQATPDIGTLVDERLWIHEATKAAQRFKTEFKEIADDPLLMRLAGQLEDERLAEAARQGLPPGDPWEAYKKHGDTIKSRFLKTAATQAQVTGTEDRLEKKRSTTTVVGAGARAQSSQPQKPPTTSEQIERMRIARMGKAIPIAR